MPRRAYNDRMTPRAALLTISLLLTACPPEGNTDSTDTEVSPTTTTEASTSEGTASATSDGSTANNTSTDSGTTGGEYLCYLSECETNSDCGDGRVCYVALDAFKEAGIKTCHSKCEVASDCAQGCEDLPVLPATTCTQGTCELVTCSRSTVDCECTNFGSVSVCL